MNRWMDGWMDGLMDGWMDGWVEMDGWKNERTRVTIEVYCVNENQYFVLYA